MLVSGVLMIASCALAAMFGIMLVLRNARQFGLVQSPNARSSHVRPTPSGGGLGLVLAGTIAGGFVAVHAPWPAALFAAAGFVIGGLGLADDVHGVPPMLRLLVEVAVLAVVICFGMPFALLPAVTGIPLPVPLLATLAVLVGVYWINLFNFMDGIDGLAASEALFLVAAAAGLALSSGHGTLNDPYFWWFLGLAAGLVVLLVFNWQPARLFMGDVGSLYLGFMIAVLALVTVLSQWLGIWEWLILAACFVSDATVTLARRAIQGEAIFSAHKRHAYQVLSRRFGSHQRVTLSFLGVNMLWLYPLALYAHNHPNWAPWTVLIAYVPLMALAYLAGAGRRQHDQLG